MRRAILTLGGTAVGLAALFSFKTHSLAGTAALSTPANPETSTTAPMSGNGSTMTTAPSAMGKSKTKSKKTSTASGSGMGSGTGMSSAAATKTSASMSASMAAKRTLTGAVENTPYGPMQVQVTMTGSKITEVTVLQHTNDGSESAQIDSNALPKLTAEALAAQSARIDAVSGASYTSSGYIQSLQSALDMA